MSLTHFNSELTKKTQDKFRIIERNFDKHILEFHGYNNRPSFKSDTLIKAYAKLLELDDILFNEES